MVASASISDRKSVSDVLAFTAFVANGYAIQQCEDVMTFKRAEMTEAEELIVVAVVGISVPATSICQSSNAVFLEDQGGKLLRGSSHVS